MFLKLYDFGTILVLLNTFFLMVWFDLKNDLKSKNDLIWKLFDFKMIWFDFFSSDDLIWSSKKWFVYSPAVDMNDCILAHMLIFICVHRVSLKQFGNVYQILHSVLSYQRATSFCFWIISWFPIYVSLWFFHKFVIMINHSS